MDEKCVCAVIENTFKTDCGEDLIFKSTETVKKAEVSSVMSFYLRKHKTLKS